ncbi:MAG: hypothetical protein HDT43_03470 [Ruminococcaceae bacterium]|nr:hypothetical protein [Oscillospiraceae bacterium]
MSTRDKAIRIIDKLNERQLEGFINMFSDFVADEVDIEEEKRKRLAAYLSVKKMVKKNPDIDYDKELAEYREEKYGR